METKSLIYINGHFYEQDGKRIELQEGSEVRVETIKKGFIETQPAGRWPIMIKDSNEKAIEVTNDALVAISKKILGEGSFLYFNIPRGKKGYEFKVELFEDLYMVKKKKGKKGEPVLYDCTCIVKENTSHNIKFFEEIFAKSLNELYKNTYVHFWGNKGNPASNAIDRFYEKPGMKDLSLMRYRKIFSSEPNLFS